MESTESPRRHLSKSLRYEVLRRDNHTCRYCGASAPDVKLTVDHVMPVALGGVTAPGNLVTACADCNAGKKATPPGAPLVDDVEQDALRWAAAMQEVAEQQRMERARLDELACDFMHVWLIHNDRHPVKDFDAAEMPSDWKATVRQFVDAGFDLADMEHGVDVAFASACAPRYTWRYFCGVMWRMLEQRRALAAQALQGHP